MLSASWWRHVRRKLLYVILFLILVVVVYLQLIQRAALWGQQRLTPASERVVEIDLGAYRLSTHGFQLAGLEGDETSGLSYRESSNSLFAITGKKASLVEISLTGEVLRRIPISGVSNLEAVEVMSDDRIAVVDERMHRLTVFHVTDQTQSLDAKVADSFDLGFADAGNKGFEGLTWDALNQRFLLAKERDPLGIFSFKLPADPAQAIKLQTLNSDELFVRDISSLSYDPHTGHTLVLSDESRLILEIDAQGKPLSFFNLGLGFDGLSLGIKQPEGLAMDAERNIYIVDESNRLYVLRKSQALH